MYLIYLLSIYFYLYIYVYVIMYIYMHPHDACWLPVVSHFKPWNYLEGP